MYPHDIVYSSIYEAGKDNVEFDYVIITLRSLGGEPFIEDLIQPLIKHDQCSIILIQNGIDIEQPIKTRYPEHLLVSVVSTINSRLAEHREIHHKNTTHLSMGSYPPPIKANCHDVRLLELGRRFKTCGVDFELVPDIVSLRWYRMLCKASFSPLGLLTGGCDTYELLTQPETEQLLVDVMEEIRSLGERVMGHNFPDWLPPSDPDKLIEMTMEVRYRSSLLVDFEKKRALELEVTLGNLVRIANKIRHKIPLIKALYALVKVADLKNRDLIPISSKLGLTKLKN